VAPPFETKHLPQNGINGGCVQVEEVRSICEKVDSITCSEKRPIHTNLASVKARLLR
jgi:hypothetical protein